MAHTGTDSRVYENGDEAYKLSGEGVKDKTRVGALQYQILRVLAEQGLRQFSLHELWKALKVDRRRVHQAITHLLRRGVVARVARGFYRLLVDPWELLARCIVQGPNAGSVKDSHDTRSEVRVAGASVSGVGLFFDNVRGYTVAGGYVRGDRDGGGGRCRVLSRGDLVRFGEISYAEVSVATGTRLFEGLGSVVVYFKCKGFGLEVVCSDWVEWRPPSGFYGERSVVDAVSVFRDRVLPYAFGLVARSGVVAGSELGRFRAVLYGLARRLYLAIGPKPVSSGSSGCRAPAVELNGDGSFSVCFRCPPTLYRRLVNSARVAGRDWNDLINEILSGVLP